MQDSLRIESLYISFTYTDFNKYVLIGKEGKREGYLNHSSLRLSFFLFYFIFKLYIIVLVLSNIKMNPPQVYMCSPS